MGIGALKGAHFFMCLGVSASRKLILMHWLYIISGLSSKAGPAWEIRRGISTSMHLEREKTVQYSLSGAL
jgi:hypothetical protein